MWSKPIGPGAFAVLLLSNATVPTDLSARLSDISPELAEGKTLVVRDLYTHKPAVGAVVGGMVVAKGVVSHGSAMFTLKLVQADELNDEGRGVRQAQF